MLERPNTRMSEKQAENTGWVKHPLLRLDCQGCNRDIVLTTERRWAEKMKERHTRITEHKVVIKRI